MMRITEVSRSDSVVRFRLDGRLTAAPAAELLAVVEPIVETGATVVLMLAGLAFADAIGIDALFGLRARGVVLIGCSSFLAEMLRVETAQRQRPRAGDDAARATAHAARLYAVAKGIVGDAGEARAALHEGLAEVARHGAPRAVADALTALSRAVVRAAGVRRRRRREPGESSLEALLPGFDEHGAWAAGSAPIARRDAHRLGPDLDDAAVRRCLQRLPDPCRAVVFMHDVAGVAADETAAVLGITSAALRARLHRARQALRSLLDQERGRGAAAATEPYSQVVRAPMA